MRLNRYLANCGLGSRRSVEAFIADGRVFINGQKCTLLATRVSEADTIIVDGRKVEPTPLATIAYHKPRGLVCTRHDELGRETIYSNLPDRFAHLPHVGRLDQDSEGLLLLTNDGELAHRLTKASSQVEKEYLVTLDRAFRPGDRNLLLDGIPILGGTAHVVSVQVHSPRRLRLILHQGLKRQIRLMLESLGYRVTRLIRLRIGSFDLSGISLRKWKALGIGEIRSLEINPKPSSQKTRQRSVQKKKGHPSKSRRTNSKRPKNFLKKPPYQKTKKYKTKQASPEHPKQARRPRRHE